MILAAQLDGVWDDIRSLSERFGLRQPAPVKRLLLAGAARLHVVLLIVSVLLR
jgi:hypothetical protein